MDRDRAVPFVVAALAVVALAVAAATLDSAVVTDGGSGIGGGGDGSGVGGGEHGSVGPEDDRPADRSTTDLAFGVCWPVVRELPVLLALALGFAGLFAAAYRSTGSPFAGGVVCLAAALPVGVVWAILAFCHPPSLPAFFTPPPSAVPENGSVVPGGSGGAGGFGDGAVDTLSAPSVLLGLLVAAAVAILLVALLSGRRRGAADGASEGAAPDGPPETETAALGRAAGAAADRIEAGDGADAENEVYRAWRRMTRALDVESPETTTPAEFAEAAIDTGMDPADVSELTDLFETVRYGGVEPTADRERRAVATLRRIEAGYGGD